MFQMSGMSEGKYQIAIEEALIYTIVSNPVFTMEKTAYV